MLIQKYKIRSQGSVAWVTWPAFKFWTPLISLEWMKIQTSNFACCLIVRDTKPENKNLVKRGRGLGHVTYFSNFGTPVIYPEGLKIQTSNFAGWLNVRDTEPKNKNLTKRGRGLGHVTYFSIFGTPLISPEGLMIQTSNFACRLKVRETKQNKPKGGVA